MRAAFTAFVAETVNTYLEQTPATEAIDRLVTRATAENMSNEADWTVMMEITDRINQSDAAREPELFDTVAISLRRRLLSTSHSTVLLALTLAEVLVKNCRESMHRRLGSERFISAVLKVATRAGSIGRQNIEQGQKALELIKDWGEAFLPLCSKPYAAVFVHAYRKLRKDGVVFPHDDVAAKPPVLGVPSSSSSGSSSSSSSSSSSASTAAVRLTAAPSVGWRVPRPNREPTRESELAVIWSVITVAWEMLLASETKEACRGNDLIQHFVGECKRLQPGVARARARAAASHAAERFVELKEVEGALVRLLELYVLTQSSGPVAADATSEVSGGGGAAAAVQVVDAAGASAAAVEDGGAGAEDLSDDHEDIYDEERKKPKRLRPPPNSTMWSNVPIGPSQELNVAGLGSIGGTGASTAVAAAVAESDSDDDEFAALAQRHDRSHVLMQRLDQLFAESAIGAPPPGEG